MSFSFEYLKSVITLEKEFDSVYNESQLDLLELITFLSAVNCKRRSFPPLTTGARQDPVTFQQLHNYVSNGVVNQIIEEHLLAFSGSLTLFLTLIQ